METMVRPWFQTRPRLDFDGLCPNNGWMTDLARRIPTEMPQTRTPPTTTAATTTATAPQTLTAQANSPSPTRQHVNIHRSSSNPNTCRQELQLQRIAHRAWLARPRGAADRVINDHCEQSNERKKVNRLGEEAPITHRTEKIHWLNSLAVSLGFAKEQLPCDVSIPAKMSELEEHLGVSHELPDVFKDNTVLIADVEGEPASEDAEEQEGARQAAEIAEFLQGVNLDEEEDVPADGEQFNAQAAEL